MRTFIALIVGLLCAAPAVADNGGTGFWITFWWPTATGTFVLLFSAFCALWAKNTGRNVWLWFFLGVMFHFIAVAILLFANNRANGAHSAD